MMAAFFFSYITRGAEIRANVWYYSYLQIWRDPACHPWRSLWYNILTPMAVISNLRIRMRTQHSAIAISARRSCQLRAPSGTIYTKGVREGVDRLLRHGVGFAFRHPPAPPSPQFRNPLCPTPRLGASSVKTDGVEQCYLKLLSAIRLSLRPGLAHNSCLPPLDSWGKLRNCGENRTSLFFKWAVKYDLQRPF